ncbi:MAG: sensor histidine kinase [Pseudomonadota bacterium]
MRDHSLIDDDDVVLGDDFVAPQDVVEDEVRLRREKRGYISTSGASLTRKIITFNLIALNILVAGILYLNASREGLAQQHANALEGETILIADVFEAQLPTAAPVNLITGDGVNVAETLAGIDLRQGVSLYVFDAEGRLAGTVTSDATDIEDRQPTYIINLISWVWNKISAPFSTPSEREAQRSIEDTARGLVPAAISDGAKAVRAAGNDATPFTVAAPIMQDGTPVGAVVMASVGGEIRYLIQIEREGVLQMFLVATLVSVGLSLILASTISNPLAELAAAAEIGGRRNRKTGQGQNGRVRIPDLTARPDEIGRLSGALRGMVGALYHRIESNEQFAADVAHEIKNPLASLRSAVGTMRLAKRDEQRLKLLDVIEHDVRRLDRLVSDISNASRLDSELVKEEQESFDLLLMLGNLSQYLTEEAEKKGVEFITDFPNEPIVITGLEGRLAQVFVNLITNATSFCGDGDAIRVWARKRENRVLVVVEDTGPGIPDGALQKIFKRFYSERPAGQFGNNSGLGLAISKQIVEAHGGVIWAENIRPTEADLTSDPLGARFVVGLPV